MCKSEQYRLNIDNVQGPITIKIGFDPTTLTDKLADIYANKFAWVFWGLWRNGHLTNQYFNDDVLRIAQIVEDTKPTTEDEFYKCIMFTPIVSGCGNFQSGDVKEFVQEHLHYLTLEKEVKFIYKF